MTGAGPKMLDFTIRKVLATNIPYQIGWVLARPDPNPTALTAGFG